ncbi:PHD finger protein 3 isoform X1 [Ornithorhynchus anatinus]|nr:PHD finger protein 3 isoform X1 [Ornithorhynchus anatinus]
MDIVDTFNHLIPTEHLDDALFLGSNLENEVCEDFSTSQNVLEDSLKNMLSDKDPMLGSASNQFCLPVLDSNDPNFQMPCSTVAGLDDIMDEGVVKESGNDTIDEEELILPNRERLEETSVTSPRKSPRLMAQEQVRSLRQSTIAKRPNAAPSSNAKKAAVKTVPAQKAGAKQPDRCPNEEEEVSAPQKTEPQKEVRRSSRRIGQTEEVTEGSLASSGHSALTTASELKDDGKQEIENLRDNQGEVDITSHELSSPSTCSATEERKNEALLGIEIKSGSPKLCKLAHKENSEPNEPEVDEMSVKGSTGHRSEELVKPPGGDDQSNIAGGTAASADDDACADSNKIESNPEVLSSSMDEVIECNSGSQTTVEVADKNLASLQGHKVEPLDLPKGADSDLSDKHLDPIELNNVDIKTTDAIAAESESNILGNSVHEPTDQNLQQVDPVKRGSHEIKLQDDVNRQSSGASSALGSKNVKSKNIKLMQQSKRDIAIGSRKKIVTVKEVTHSKTRPSVKHISGVHKETSVNLKRNADEQGCQQAFHKPVKVRKKHGDKDVKSHSCGPGIKSLKSQSSTVLKKGQQTQNPVLTQKPLTHSLGDKAHAHLSCSKDLQQPTSAHLPHSSQKQGHKQPQQQGTASRVNSHIKEEMELKDSLGLEHLKEDDKLKLKKTEKNVQPRQRRSSKSLSLDEPPLFIPDNIASVKREGSEHVSSCESKYVWAPSKQCGFCKKPHGNRNKMKTDLKTMKVLKDVLLHKWFQSTHEPKFMVGCGRCDDWFHGDCVGLSLSQAQQMGEEDKEYVCVKCCAEEDKKSEPTEPDILENQAKVEGQREKIMEFEKPGLSKQVTTNISGVVSEKTKQADDAVKHKVKILRRESSDSRNSPESRDSEIKKWQLAPLRKMGQPALPRRASDEKNEKATKESPTGCCTGEKSTKSGGPEKQEVKKKKAEKGGLANVPPPAAPAPKPSADQIRQSVKHSLKDILMKRLTDSNLKIPEERASKVAMKIEKELFSFFRDTDAKYKNKYRSLMFNLKDPKNNILFKKVLKGEVTPDHLIRMSPEELASKELAAWRRRENRHTIEMIEKEQREVERRPITKITHKGEIEIESDAPMKEQEEAMEIQEPTAIKSMEKAEEFEKEKEESDSLSKDTTSQHKKHLFDLNCKICIGRMAPPADDLTQKKVKVAVGVVRKQSDNEAENIADALSSTSSILASDLFEEEKQESPKSTFSPAPRPEMPGAVEVESTFLARLNFIWKGFINMPSVAKFVIKAYPVSGSPEYLTEDLPDSIQVGGRISPQTVWDYVEKIKASGTKDICVVRFTPVTEEDQISYTLLFAYFSSRRRYGVAANNMKQVKDMYLIPLGASDKIPHPLVPFDGPGLELHRPNLLLGLIIRQKTKRQFSASSTSTSTSLVDEVPESPSINLPPDKKIKIEISNEEELEEENDFFNSFTTVLHKQRNKPQQPPAEEIPAVIEPVVEMIKQEPSKPLRFLPGVLVGWENQPSTLELANKPLPVDDILQSLLGSTGQTCEKSHPGPEKCTAEEIPLIDEQASLKEEKAEHMEVTVDEAKEIKHNEDDPPAPKENSAEVEDVVVEPTSQTPGSLPSLSLKGKPPDVSTEAFLANLSMQSQHEETGECKEKAQKGLGQDQETSSQEHRTSTSSSPVKGNTEPGATESTSSSTSRSPQFINLKRDPRQAVGRTQPLSTGDSKDGDGSGNEEKQTVPGPTPDKESPGVVEAEEKEPEVKQTSVEKDSPSQQSDSSKGEGQETSVTVESASTSQTEDPKQEQDNALMQNIETVHSFRRGLAATTSSHFEGGNPPQPEFTPQSTSPGASGNFLPIRPQQHNFPHPKPGLPGFPFQGPPNFPPQSMFGFPPHLPPPLLPPPGFAFAQNPMMPWPPVVHLSGQPHFMGPLAQGSRYISPQNFYPSKDNRRPERRHSDPWGRHEQQQLERSFSRVRADQHRQRFYSDSHHLKKERHEKEWEQDERHRRRDRNQEKERDRKSREEGHKDKERGRLSHSERSSDRKSSRDRSSEKKSDKSKSEDYEKDKDRDKSRHRDSEKDRDRHHKDRDHTDRGRSKR